MADELSISAALYYAKGGRSFDSEGLGFNGVILDVTNTKLTYNTQMIGTGVEAIDLGDLTAANVGYMICKNLAAEGGGNYITIRGGSTGADVVKVRPGGIALFELATTAPYAIATSSQAELMYAIIEV